MPVRMESGVEPIPGYQLIERLGGGGFGEVWKCEAPGKIQKAIKFVYGNLDDVTVVDDSIKAEQELRSIERIKNIRHPYILSIERYEIIDGQLMIVTELADCNLYERFREYRNKGATGIPREELLDYMEEIAEALDIMTTEHDLLHLDIKPQNLFLMYNHIKIGDFGLVKDLEGMHAQVTGGVTPVYAAPETFEGYVSRYSDQYSLAIVFQELLTGVRPFSGANPKQLMLQHVQMAPTLDPLPPGDRPIIAKALSKKPAERWENCMAMVQALRKPHRVAVETPPDLTEPATPVSLPVNRVPETRGHSAPPINTTTRSTHRVDDYFELGPLPQLVDPKSGAHSSTLTHVKKGSNRTTFTPALDSSTGVLRPVVLIGMGQFGRATLQWIRQGLELQFGPTGLPIVRFIAIDTDPAAPANHLADVGDREDLLLTRLNRPARYIRSRDSLPPVEDWLNSNVLYRMPRNQLTSGIRALGRLALVEHIRAFRSRLERDLQAITDTQALADAEKLTKATYLTTRPRVYLIGHLGGGTASGMLIDAAFIVKKMLRTMNFDENEVHALCYVPDQQCMEIADLPEANAVAALVELNHFQQKVSPFRALYESKSEWLEDNKPPFTQIQFIETPPRITNTQDIKDQASQQIQKAAEVLCRIITSPLGRVADPAKLTAGTTPYQAMGLRVLHSPRRSLVRRAGHLIFQRIMGRWLEPATTEIQEKVKLRIEGYFHYENFMPESLVKYFEKAAQNALGTQPDVYIQQLIAPFQPSGADKLPNPEEIKKALRDIIHRLGSSAGDGSSANTLMLADDNTKLNRALRDACEKLVRSGATRLVYTIFRHLDKPGLRVGATEEALRYSLTRLDGWIAAHEAKARQSQLEFAQALEYLRQDLAEFDRQKPQPKKKWPSMTLPGERLLSIYRARFRSLVHEQIAKVYIGFRGACSDQHREVRFCRNRLHELQQTALTMEKLPEKPLSSSRVTESVLLPYGCQDLLQAVEQFAQSITPDDLAKIDTVVSERLERKHPRLAELCFSTIEQLYPVRDLIMQEAKRFLEQRLTLGDAAALFIEGNPRHQEAYRKIFLEAEPMLHLKDDSDCKEAAFLMYHDSPAGQKLGELGVQAFPHTQIIHIARNDEVVVYRAMVGITLDNLPALGEAGLHAYQTALAIEHFTPHARQDIDQWQIPCPVSQ